MAAFVTLPLVLLLTTLNAVGADEDLPLESTGPDDQGAPPEPLNPQDPDLRDDAPMVELSDLPGPGDAPLLPAPDPPPPIPGDVIGAQLLAGTGTAAASACLLAVPCCGPALYGTLVGAVVASVGNALAGRAGGFVVPALAAGLFGAAAVNVGLAGILIVTLNGVPMPTTGVDLIDDTARGTVGPLGRAALFGGAVLVPLATAGFAVLEWVLLEPPVSSPRDHSFRAPPFFAQSPDDAAAGSASP